MMLWLPIVVAVIGVLAWLGIRKQEEIDRTKPRR
jgi:hypothetical protein